MGRFESRPLAGSESTFSSRLNGVLRKNPALFGVPFIVIIVGASFGLSSLTQLKYDHSHKKVRQVSLPFRDWLPMPNDV